MSEFKVVFPFERQRHSGLREFLATDSDRPSRITTLDPNVAIGTIRTNPPDAHNALFAEIQVHVGGGDFSVVVADTFTDNLSGAELSSILESAMVGVYKGVMAYRAYKATISQ